MGSFAINVCFAAFLLFMPFAVSPVPFVEGSLDTTIDNKDSSIIFLCGEDFGEPMTMLEFVRLVGEGVITVGGLPLPSAAPDIGVQRRGEA